MDWTTDRIILDPAGARSQMEADHARIADLLEASNRYQQEARDARAAQRGGFQHRVDPWLLACFGETIARDKTERSHRFLEESLEAVQAAGTTRSEAHQLVDYVFDRPPGELDQEVGGVEVTLAAFCLAFGINKTLAAETELTRCWTKVEKIRAKQQAKPQFSPLPAHPDSIAEIAAERRRQVEYEGWKAEHDDKHVDGSIAQVAACYADPDPAMSTYQSQGYDGAYRDFPIPARWPLQTWSPVWWKPTDRIRDLVKAGALIAAEIDRLRRAGPASEPQS